MKSVDILNTVSDVFEVPVSVLASRSIRREVVDARYVGYHYLLRELRFSPQRVARIFCRERSLYAHALKQYDAFYKTDSVFRRKANAVAELLGLEVVE